MLAIYWKDHTQASQLTTIASYITGTIVTIQSSIKTTAVIMKAVTSKPILITNTS